MTVTRLVHKNAVGCAVILTICLINDSHVAADHVTGTQNAGKSDTDPEHLTITGHTGKRGGVLVFSERSEPKTLNPLVALDLVSRSFYG